MGRPSDGDRLEALRRFLAGLSRSDDANQLVVDIADLHMRHNTFPGEVLMELAADALDSAGIERDTGIAHRELLSRQLLEVEFRGKEHRRIQYAVLTVFAVHADSNRICSTRSPTGSSSTGSTHCSLRSPSSEHARNSRALRSSRSWPTWPLATPSTPTEDSPIRSGTRCETRGP